MTGSPPTSGSLPAREWGEPSARCQESAGRAGPRPRLGGGAGAGTRPRWGSQARGTGGRLLHRPPARPRRPVVGARLAAPQCPSVVRCAVRAVYRPPVGRAPGPAPHLALPRLGHPGALTASTIVGARAPRPAPPRPTLPRQAGLAALRGRPVPGTGSEPPRREAPAEAQGRPLWVSVPPRPRWLRCECGRPARPALQPCAVPSPACSPYQSDGLRGRAGAARPSQLDGGGHRGHRGDPPGTRSRGSAQGRAELAAEAGGSRGGGGVGAADWVGQEKRRETALCRFPLPAGPPLAPPGGKAAFPRPIVTLLSIRSRFLPRLPRGSGGHGM